MPDPIAAPAPLSIHGIRPEGLIARAVDWIFGYISLSLTAMGTECDCRAASRSGSSRQASASFSTRRNTGCYLIQRIVRKSRVAAEALILFARCMFRFQLLEGHFEYVQSRRIVRVAPRQS